MVARCTCVKQLKAKIVKYNITPTPAPRQTRSDTWNPRPCVLRYRAFKDEVRSKRVKYDVGQSITFHMPMPPSWSKKKKIAHNGQPHTCKPDIDNILKSLFDSLYKDDSHIWHMGEVKKIWAFEGAIEII